MTMIKNQKETNDLAPSSFRATTRQALSRNNDVKKAFNE